MPYLALTPIPCSQCGAWMGAHTVTNEETKIPPLYCAVCLAASFHYARVMGINCIPTPELWRAQRNAASDSTTKIMHDNELNSRTIQVIRKLREVPPPTPPDDVSKKEADAIREGIPIIDGHLLKELLHD